MRVDISLIRPKNARPSPLTLVGKKILFVIITFRMEEVYLPVLISYITCQANENDKAINLIFSKYFPFENLQRIAKASGTFQRTKI